MKWWLQSIIWIRKSRKTTSRITNWIRIKRSSWIKIGESLSWRSCWRGSSRRRMSWGRRLEIWRRCIIMRLQQWRRVMVLSISSWGRSSMSIGCRWRSWRRSRRRMPLVRSQRDQGEQGRKRLKAGLLWIISILRGWSWSSKMRPGLLRWVLRLNCQIRAMPHSLSLSSQASSTPSWTRGARNCLSIDLRFSRSTMSSLISIIKMTRPSWSKGDIYGLQNKMKWKTSYSSSLPLRLSLLRRIEVSFQLWSSLK